MRSLAPLACGLSFLIAAPALAIDQDIELTATVTSSCTIMGSSAPSALAAAIPVNNGMVDTTPLNFDIPMHCNAPASLVVGSLRGGLRGPGSFQHLTNRIDYVANVRAPFYLPISLDTTGASGQIFTEDYAPSNAPIGSIEVTITPKATNPYPLRQGTYTDTLRMTFTPSQ